MYIWTVVEIIKFGNRISEKKILFISSQHRGFMEFCNLFNCRIWRSNQNSWFELFNKWEFKFKKNMTKINEQFLFWMFPFAVKMISFLCVHYASVRVRLLPICLSIISKIHVYFFKFNIMCVYHLEIRDLILFGLELSRL